MGGYTLQVCDFRILFIFTPHEWSSSDNTKENLIYMQKKEKFLLQFLEPGGSFDPLK